MASTRSSPRCSVSVPSALETTEDDHQRSSTGCQFRASIANIPRGAQPGAKRTGDGKSRAAPPGLQRTAPTGETLMHSGERTPLAASNGSWNGWPGNPTANGAVSAIRRAICAGSGYAAWEHASRNASNEFCVPGDPAGYHPGRRAAIARRRPTILVSRPGGRRGLRAVGGRLRPLHGTAYDPPDRRFLAQSALQSSGLGWFAHAGHGHSIPGSTTLLLMLPVNEGPQESSFSEFSWKDTSARKVP